MYGETSITDFQRRDWEEMAQESNWLHTRVAELERENAELKVYKRRWETVERLAEARGFTSHEWVILFKTGDLDFAAAVDNASREIEQ